jgi:protein-disulfide isomerase
MERLILALALVAVAVAVAALVDRRRTTDAPTQPTWTVPAQLDRGEFSRPEAPWLVVVFSSATCDSCRDTVAKAIVLAGVDVAVEDVEVGASPDRHRRYGIDAVPVVVIADAEGVVRTSFVGPPTATDLWAAMAKAREPSPPAD